jgi:hypothetical protein
VGGNMSKWASILALLEVETDELAEELGQV